MLYVPPILWSKERVEPKKLPTCCFIHTESNTVLLVRHKRRYAFRLRVRLQPWLTSRKPVSATRAVKIARGIKIFMSVIISQPSDNTSFVVVCVTFCNSFHKGRIYIISIAQFIVFKKLHIAIQQSFIFFRLKII